MNDAPNRDQSERWTGEFGANWVSQRDAYDAELAPFADEVLRRAAITGGERCLDVGCGTGALTVLAARAGAPAQAVGLDISSTMLDEARRRAADEAVANATFVCADAQVASFGDPAFGEGGFDVLVSRFGVMFFADPVTAFANLASAMTPGGRLAFVCWQGIAANPWMAVANDAVAPYVDAVAAASDDTPGPFGLASRRRIVDVLERAGWSDITADEVQIDLHLAGPGSVEHTVEFWLQRPAVAAAIAAGPADLEGRLRGSLHAAFAPRHDGVGVRFDSAIWSVGARRH